MGTDRIKSPGDGESTVNLAVPRHDDLQSPLPLIACQPQCFAFYLTGTSLLPIYHPLTTV